MGPSRVSLRGGIIHLMAGDNVFLYLIMGILYAQFSDYEQLSSHVIVHHLLVKFPDMIR